MRTFEIVSTLGRRKTPVAWLHYDEASSTAEIDISPSARIGHVPAMFDRHIELGQLHVNAAQTANWVQERVPPSSRHNIDDVLKANGLDSYDPYQLLISKSGKSSQDDFMLREVDQHRNVASYEYQFVSLKDGLGESIAQVRKERGITQNELAQRTGIQQSLLSRIENGKANPTLETIVCIADALGMNITLDLS